MLNIAIKGLHIDLTDALKTHVYDKLAALEKFVQSHSHITVEIGRPSKHHKTGTDVYMAEITADTHGQTYFIQITDGNLYSAIDRARDEILELIKQGKGKKQTLLRKGRMMLKELQRKGFYGWNK